MTSEQLSFFMTTHNHSRTSLGKVLGIHRDTVARYLKGDTIPPYIELAVKALGAGLKLSDHPGASSTGCDDQFAPDPNGGV